MRNGQLAVNNYIHAGQSTSLAVDADGRRLRKPLYGEIWPGTKPVSKPVPKPKSLQSLSAAEQGWLRDLSWEHQAGSITNANINRFFTKVFAYSLDGFIETASEDFTTDYYDVLSDTQYGPDIADEAAINVSVDANQTVTEHRLKFLTTSFGKVSFGVSHSLKELSRKRCRRDIVNKDQKIRFHDILPVLRLQRDLATTHAGSTRFDI